jgi:Mlc titration factor MtfA (ptsG expression regulator)
MMVNRIIKFFIIISMAVFFTACEETESTVETQEEISINRIMEYSKKGKVKPTLLDYTSLGITGVKNENIELINYVVKSTDSKKLSTTSKIKSLVNSIIEKYNKSISIIKKYANSNTNTQPKVSNYQNIGILKGVTKDNLIHVNRAIDKSYSSYVDTTLEVQSIVDRVNEARVIIDAYATDDTKQIPSIGDYEIFAVTGITLDNKTEFDALIAQSDKKSIHTTAQMQMLIDRINKSRTIIKRYADSNTNTQPKVNVYREMGITGVTDDNLIHVNRAIDKTYSSYVDSKVEVQKVVDRVNEARAIIDAYANDNTAQIPTIADYEIFAVTGITLDNKTEFDILITQSGDDGVHTTLQMQTLIDGINKSRTIIKRYADSNTNTQPKVSDYVEMGITGVTDDNLIHVNRAIDKTYSSYVDSKQEVQRVVDRVNEARAIIDAYANDDTEQIPTIADYEIFAVTGITLDNKKEFDALITQFDDEAVHTTLQMQTLIDKINKARKVIQRYADSNTNTQPKVSDYKTMGIIGVTDDNLKEVNSAIEKSYSSYVDSKEEVQAIVDAII